MWYIHCRFQISDFRPQNASPGCGCVRNLGATFQNAEFRYHTVDFRAIEIDLQEAISRFLNVPGKSGRQSVHF